VVYRGLQIPTEWSRTQQKAFLYVEAEGLLLKDIVTKSKEYFGLLRGWV
jgi:hypothetical protein